MLTSSVPVVAPADHMTKLTEYQAYESGQYLLKNTYRYLGQIQKGSFGQVTLAVNVHTATKVAMKAMHKVRDVAPMARHEIRVLRKLGTANEHICQLVDHFETEDYIVLVLEYCANGDMYDMIHLSHVGPRAVDVWNLAKELHLGLSYAHLLGIYHRDIKPENILFTETGRVKICDWGLATYTRQSKEFNVGTEKYMAPECFLDSPISGYGYDCKYADYWSVGVTLLTAVFGTSPFKPVRAHDPSSDAFCRKKQEVKKSLESDCNFKNFVFYNMLEVLYDIYPTMNSNCFRIFMNVLQVGGLEDDVECYMRKISQRSLDKLVADLEANWKFGLTVWDEEEVDMTDETINHDSVFDMDDIIVSDENDNENGQEDNTNEKTNEKVNDENENGDRQEKEFYDKHGIESKHAVSIPVPSLVESTGASKSWYDLEDDAEFSKLFQSLSFRDMDRKAGRNVHIVEKELVGLSWSDY